MSCKKIILALFWLVVSLSNLILLSPVLFLESGKSWADSSTLRPTGDRGKTNWSDYPSAGDDYEKIDDTTPDGDSTYLFTTSTGSDYRQGWHADSFQTTDNIDSVKLTVRAKSIATSGTDEIIIGRLYDAGEGFWSFCTNDGATDTIGLTSSYTDYSITWANDPYDGSNWTKAELNNTGRAWGFESKSVGTYWNTVLQDNFNDNSLDTDKWIERSKGGSSAAEEQNQRMELNLDHTAHTGAGIYTKNTYTKTQTYALEVDFQTNIDYDVNSAGYGFDGIWILRGDTSGTNFWDQYYGAPTTGLYFRIGNSCGYNNDGIGIYYDDDLGWEASCPWDTTIAENTTDVIDTSSDSWYSIRMVFNGASGLCSLKVNGTTVTGTLGSNFLSDLGSAIRFQLYTSFYNTSTKWDRYDNLALSENKDADNRVTQSFIDVFYSEVVAKRRGGIVQDQNNQGIAEGGIAR